MPTTNNSAPRAAHTYLRLPVSLKASHFDAGIHCVTIVDAVGRVVVRSVAQDDARELAQVLNSHAALVALLREALNGCTQTQFHDWEKRAEAVLQSATEAQP